jgi:hypothetical protein
MRDFSRVRQENRALVRRCFLHQLIPPLCAPRSVVLGSLANTSKRQRHYSSDRRIGTINPLCPTFFHHPRPVTTLVDSAQSGNSFQISGLPPNRQAPYGMAGAGQDSLDKAEHFLHNRDASVATLRWCSGSSRNAVRLPFGMSVQLRRNPQAGTFPCDDGGQTADGHPRRPHCLHFVGKARSPHARRRSDRAVEAN